MKNIHKYLLSLLVVSCSLFVAHGARAAPNELAQVQAQLKQVEQQNKAAEQQVKKSDANVEQTKKDLVRAAGRVEKLEVERGVLRDNISDLEKNAKTLEASIKANQGRMADAAASLLSMSAQPAFSTDDAREYVLTSALLTGVAGQFDAEMKAAAARIAELEKVQEQKKAEQTKLAATAKKYGAEKTELDKLLRTRTTQNEKLRAEQFELQKKLRELSARAKNLAELTAGVGGTKLSADASFSTKKLNAPVGGRLTAVFGEKSALGLVSDGWRIRTRADALVTAPADGVVKFADNFKGFGRVLILSHKNGYNSVMAGLAAADVLVGQEVLAGEPVGRMPAAGKDGARPEMYLEVRRGANLIDPARLFNEPE
ncbi:MAG: peptidoglycan DD-metalloendopeptidase family protein [Alphaproteobacteria bacterium]|nr:peptidoglycan DD-metalloendopeptidase family protein [Alphaproteobacteria bacterium]